MRVLTKLATLFTALAALCTLAACGKDAPRRAVAGGDAAQGKRLVEQYQCGSCHAIPGARTAASNVGPSLSAFGKRSYIAGQFPNLPEPLVAWLVDPPAMKPGTMMPNLGVSRAEARHMAAYLYSVE